MTLSASPATLWPTQFSTLTATANADVGPTPYYIRIYDQTAGQYVATCAVGTTCSLGVTESTASTQDYVALIADAEAVYPPGNLVAISSGQQVEWESVSVDLLNSASTVADGNPVFIQSVASADIGPSPFFLSVWDATTGTLFAQCGFGAFCPASSQVPYSASDTTQEFIAYVADYSASFPPSAIQATSHAFITWTSSGWQVSLSGPTIVHNHAPATYTATASADVGPTPYWIEIFDATTGTLLADCGSGATCSATTFEPSAGGDDIVAFVSSLGGTLPPANIQASAKTVFTIGETP